MAVITPSNFVTPPNPPAGQENVQFLDPNALTPIEGLVPITPAPPPSFSVLISGIEQAITADQTASTPGTTPQIGNNIEFTDLTVGVSGTITGDVFKGGGFTDINTQFIALTPDNLLIRATTPGAFLQSGSGDDILIAAGGHNILDGGSGRNLYVGSGGTDTYIQDTSKTGGTATVENFGGGDTAILFGLKFTDFTVSVEDSIAGLTWSFASKTDPTRSTEMILPGLTTADIKAGKFSTVLSLSTVDPNQNFFAVHVN